MRLSKSSIFFASLVFALIFYACEDSAVLNYEDNLVAEKYINSLCEGLSAFSSSLEASEGTENITEEINRFISFLESLTPPSVLNEWHDDYIVFLGRVIDDPEYYAEWKPRKLTKQEREHFASLERKAPICKEVTYFSEPIQ